MSDYAKRLTEIERRLAEAGEGPWVAVEVHCRDGWETAIRLPTGGHVFGVPSMMVPFVAGVRQDVPWLIEQLRAASEALDKAGTASHYVGPTRADRDEVMPLANRIQDLASERDCRIEDIALASKVLTAAGIPDDGRPVAERVKALARHALCCAKCGVLLGSKGVLRGPESEPNAELDPRWSLCEMCDQEMFGEAAEAAARCASGEHRWVKDCGNTLVSLCGDCGMDLGDEDDAEERDATTEAEIAAFAGVDPPVASALDRLRDPVIRAAFNSNLPALHARREQLGDQIDAHDMADPPTKPPEELVREYQSVREKIAATEKAARGTPRINILPVEPVRSYPSAAFVDGPGRHGVETIMVHDYPESPRGDAVRKFRVEHDISLGDLARALRICPSDVSGIERGSKTTDDAGWREIQTAMFLLASEPKERHAEEAGYLADPMSRPGIERLLGLDDESAEQHFQGAIKLLRERGEDVGTLLDWAGTALPKALPKPGDPRVPLTEDEARWVLTGKPAAMDAPDGPRCGCGLPSADESGLCGTCGHAHEKGSSADDGRRPDHEPEADRLDTYLVATAPPVVKRALARRPTQSPPEPDIEPAVVDEPERRPRPCGCTGGEPCARCVRAGRGCSCHDLFHMLNREPTDIEVSVYLKQHQSIHSADELAAAVGDLSPKAC